MLGRTYQTDLLSVDYRSGWTLLPTCRNSPISAGHTLV